MTRNTCNQQKTKLEGETPLGGDIRTTIAEEWWFVVEDGGSELRSTTASADIVSPAVDASLSDVGRLVYLRLDGSEGP